MAHRQDMKGFVVTVQIKSPTLQVIFRQTSLTNPTWSRYEITDVSGKLIAANWKISPDFPIRAITIGVSRLTPAAEAVEQVDLFDLMDEEKQKYRKRRDQLEAAVDKLRLKLGNDKVSVGFQDNKDIGINRG